MDDFGGGGGNTEDCSNGVDDDGDSYIDCDDWDCDDDPVCDDNFYYYVSELDDATKILLYLSDELIVYILNIKYINYI